MSHPEEAWNRLGDLLTERRVQISPEYRNRLKFVADTGLHERLVSDLERGRRTSYRSTSLQAVEVAYRLVPGSLERTLAGGALEPQEPVAYISQAQFTTPQPPQPGVQVEHYDDGHMRVGVTVDTSISMDDAIASLGELTDGERATVYMLKGGGYTPAEVAGAVLLLRGMDARRAADPPEKRRKA